MQVILGNLEMMQHDLGEESEFAGMLKDGKASAHRAADLSQKMLDYSGHGVVMQRVLDIGDLVRRGVDSCSDRVPGSVVLNVEIEDIRISLQGNKKQIEHAVGNLVENSLEAIGQGPGCVDVRVYLKAYSAEDLRGNLTGKPLKHGDYVVIEVRDDGCGIRLNNFHRLFEPFYSTKFTGRGLGLPVVQGVMRGHYGAVFVESDPDVGSCFRLLFPVKKS